MAGIDMHKTQHFLGCPGRHNSAQGRLIRDTGGPLICQIDEVVAVDSLGGPNLMVIENFLTCSRQKCKGKKNLTIRVVLCKG